MISLKKKFDTDKAKKKANKGICNEDRHRVAILYNTNNIDGIKWHKSIS